MYIQTMVIQKFYHYTTYFLNLTYIPNMQPNIHCNVAGKLLAAAIERQKPDMSFIFKAVFPGATLCSGLPCSVAVVPA